jgi:predicted DNA-binding protein
MKKVTFYLPSDVIKDYKLLSKRTKRTVSSLVREAIDEHIERGIQYLSEDPSDATPENVPYAGG